MLGLCEIVGDEAGEDPIEVCEGASDGGCVGEGDAEGVSDAVEVALGKGETLLDPKAYNPLTEPTYTTPLTTAGDE